MTEIGLLPGKPKSEMRPKRSMTSFGGYDEKRLCLATGTDVFYVSLPPVSVLIIFNLVAVAVLMILITYGRYVPDATT